MTPEHAQRIALLRPLLIFLVITVHIPGSLYRPDTKDGIPGLESYVNVLFSGTLGMVAVPILSIIAGYLAVASLSRYGYPGFVWRKVKHLLLPMLLWNFIVALMVAYGQYQGASPRADLTLYPFNLEHWLAGLSAIGKLPANAPLYFLRELFLACCLIPLWRFVAKSAWLSALVLAALWWVSANQLDPHWIYRLDIYLFFCLGLVLATRFTLSALDTFTQPYRPVILVTLGSACLLLALYASLTPAEHFLWWAKGLMVVAPLLFWELGGVIQRTPALALVKRALLKLSPATFTIFLGHILVIQVLWHGWISRYHLNLYQEAYLLVWLVIVVSVYVSLYALWWATQYARRYWRRTQAASSG